MTKKDLARLEAALANYVGPIAALIIERARTRASSFEVLYQRVAWEIDNDADRSAFLRQMTALPVRNGADQTMPVVNVVDLDHAAIEDNDPLPLAELGQVLPCPADMEQRKAVTTRLLSPAGDC